MIMLNKASIHKILNKNLETHTEILKDAYAASLVSLEAFQNWAFDAFKDLGIEAETFNVEFKEVKVQPAFRKTYADSFSESAGPRNVLGRLNPKAEGGILFYAHADKHPATYEYGEKHPELIETDDRFLGAGLADDVSGIAAMISALKVYLDLGFTPGKQILVASILGKEGGVFGTYGLMKRYGPLGAAVYLHPAESGGGLGELKIASNGLIEFTISVDGKPPESTEVHQTIFSKSAVSAVEKAMFIHQGLQGWAEKQSQTYHHPEVEEMAKQSFAITIGKLNGGCQNEVFEIPLSCEMSGTISFPPNARLENVKENFVSALNEIAETDAWLSKGNWKLDFGDRIAESAESDADSEFVRKSAELVQAYTGRTPDYFYGHSMSDIRYPLLFWEAQAFGIGPLSGGLGKEVEWVDKKEYFLSIAVLTEMMCQFAN
jgi:acetylornithine deacetylase/succinyl-diaminopimelate desuccinylase-like protein